MLVICFNDGYDVEWHVGDVAPLQKLMEKHDNLGEREVNRVQANILDKVFMLQADGHELQYIMEQYVSLPGHDSNGHSRQYGYALSIPSPRGKRIVRWAGDIARTILLNL